MKFIHFTNHAKRQMIERRVIEDEIKEVIQNGKWQVAEKGRFSASLPFPFNGDHYGRFYRTKEVVPIFVEEANRIVVITVYTFFSQRRV